MIEGFRLLAKMFHPRYLVWLPLTLPRVGGGGGVCVSKYRYQKECSIPHKPYLCIANGYEVLPNVTNRHFRIIPGNLHLFVHTNLQKFQEM